MTWICQTRHLSVDSMVSELLLFISADYSSGWLCERSHALALGMVQVLLAEIQLLGSLLNNIP